MRGTRGQVATIGGCDVLLLGDGDRGQGEEYFYLKRDMDWEFVRYHDYATICSVPGLYDWLFYDVLQCQSHRVIGRALASQHAPVVEQRVLDLGAGNGVIGQQLRAIGIDAILGFDRYVLCAG